MAHERVDGMNVITVFEAAERAIETVRSGTGPRMLEIMTYRYRGHSMGDPERYRQQEEVKKWEEQDPIGIYSSYLVNKKLATEKVLEEIENHAADDVNKAVEFAEASPEPALETLFDNVYAEEA